MLSVTRLNSPITRQTKLFEEIQGEGLGKTWVVSDLRSKFEIQRQILSRQGYYEDLHVLRASELWKLLLRRVRPDLRVVSTDLIRALVKDQMETLELPLGPSSDQAICDFMDQFAPVIFYPGGADQLRAWFEKNPQSYERWGAWYRLAEQFAPHFLEKGMLAPTWVSSVLLSELSQAAKPEALWSRPLIVDLGCELTQTESDLVQILSRDYEVEVLKPEPNFSARYSSLLTPYDHLPVKRLNTLKSETSSASLKKTYRFSGMLAEVKHAVAQTRIWADQGINLAQIAILAPDIESYWPVLSEFLQVEGLPTQKEKCSRLQSLPVVHQWISSVRVRAGLIEPGQLEVATYGPELSLSTQMKVEEFQSLFKNILGVEDLVRAEAIQRHFGRSLRADQVMGVEEFLGVTLPYWTRRDVSEVLEILIKDFLVKVSGANSSEMKLSNWLFLLERLISKKEIRVLPADGGGVLVANFSDGNSVLSSHRIFLGLSQSQLKARSVSWILPSEIHSFNRDHGFYLLDPESSRVSFELEWLEYANAVEDHFCFPGTAWDGGIETPSQVWMEKRISEGGLEFIHQVQTPEKTRWDEVQDSHRAEVFPVNPAEMAVKKRHHLSASSFQRYRDCPFIFFAEKGLELTDPPEVDLDLDRRTKGRLIHSVLEKITAPERFLTWTREQLSELLDQERALLPPGFIHDGLWGPLRERNISLALKFQEQEKTWRGLYPKSKILARELSFDFEYEGMRFKGVMDRVDGDDSRAVILDYKTSESQVKTFAKWFSENQLQLGFYTWILEKGFVQELGIRKVVGAFFYVLKTLDRSTGFKITEADGLLDVDRRKSQITAEAKTEFLEKLEQEINLVAKKIITGEFLPEPRELEICNRCRWRGLCRAPHLN
jgi:hypothetical protein